MPGQTTNRGYPYPVDADPIDVAGDVQALAEAIDFDVENLTGYASNMQWIGLASGWASGLIQVGSLTIAPTPAGGPSWSFIMMTHIYCVGAASGGADLTGANMRFEYYDEAAVLRGASQTQLGHDDQCSISGSLSTGMTAGYPGGRMDIKLSTDKPCNMTGWAVYWMMPGSINLGLDGLVVNNPGDPVWPFTDVIPQPRHV